MSPLRLYYFFDPTLLELLKYCKKLANLTQTTQSGDTRNCQGMPGEARRSQEVPEGLQDDSNPPLDLKHQKPAKKACEPYVPLTFILLFWPDIVRIVEILQETSEFDPNDTVRRHQELPGDARRGQEKPGGTRRAPGWFKSTPGFKTSKTCKKSLWTLCPPYVYTTFLTRHC